MEYLEAIEIVKAKQCLIGKTVKGETIDEFIICPTNSDRLQSFQKEYYKTFSANVNLIDKNEDVQIAVIIGKKHLITKRLALEWKSIDWVEENID